LLHAAHAAVRCLLCCRRHGRIGRTDHSRAGWRPPSVHFPVLALGERMTTSRLPQPGKVREITSFSNPVIKDIRALALKKHRDRQDAFLAEGLKLVIDALAGGWQVRTLILSRAAQEQKQAADVAARVRANGGDILIVPEKILGAIARRENPQQVIAVCGRRSHRLAAVEPGTASVWIGLDRVRDPGNLGTIIRTADAAGASGVILIGDCTDPFGPEAVRASMGSIFAVPL